VVGETGRFAGEELAVPEVAKDVVAAPFSLVVVAAIGEFCALGCAQRCAKSEFFGEGPGGADLFCGAPAGVCVVESRAKCCACSLWGTGFLTLHGG